MPAVASTPATIAKRPKRRLGAMEDSKTMTAGERRLGSYVPKLAKAAVGAGLSQRAISVICCMLDYTVERVVSDALRAQRATRSNVLAERHIVAGATTALGFAMGKEAAAHAQEAVAQFRASRSAK